MNGRNYAARPVERVALTDQFWALATAVSLLVVGLLPLLWDARYFFHGDTQVAYVGWWYELGDQVLKGHLPLLDPLTMASGNHAAEGQWGLFSPLTMLIGIGARVAPNLAVYATLIKLGFLIAGGLGTYLLLRSFHVGPPAAYVGGLVVGLSGMSVYVDWPSWVNGQIATALLPWAWWSTRRMMRGANPFVAIVLCYLVVCIGYVYAAAYLAIVLLGCLVQAAVERNRVAFLRALAVGVISGLIVITVYLPGILTAPVTVRSGWAVEGTGRTTVEVSDLLASMLPTVPTRYLLWFLPMVLWIDAARARTAIRELAGVLVSTALLLAWALGPAVIGPLRWPGRVMPAVMVGLTVLVVVLVARSVRVPLGRGRLAASLVWVAVGGYLTTSRDWASRGAILLGVVVVVGGLLLVATLLARGSTAVALAMGGWTILAFAVQHAAVPEARSGDWQLPALASDYRTQLPAARGDVMLLGSPAIFASKEPAKLPTIADELLIGSAWYLNPRSVQAGQTTMDFVPFGKRFCRWYTADACRDPLKAVLERDDTTGLRWLDLLSVSTVVFFRPEFRESDLDDPPTGWRLADRSDWTVTWVRDGAARPTAGGVVWVSDGVQVHEQQGDPQTVCFTVDEVPAHGGTVVLSRLAWPGYEASGASLDDPLEQLLVRVRIEASSAGQQVTVHWDPPGWQVERLAWWLAIVAAAVWSVVETFSRRRFAGAELAPAV